MILSQIAHHGSFISGKFPESKKIAKKSKLAIKWLMLRTPTAALVF